jgi:hypothetical protein
MPVPDYHMKATRKKKANWWPLVAGALIFVIFQSRDWNLAGLEVPEKILLACIAVMAIAPVLLWYRRGMPHLPVGEIFAAMFVVYDVAPCLTGREDWLGFPTEVRFKTLCVAAVYLASFIITYHRITASKRNPRLLKLAFLHREIQPQTAWKMFLAWLSLILIQLYGVLPDLGSATNVLVAASSSLGNISVAILFYRMGQGRLSGSILPVVLVGGFAFGLAISFLSGFLVGGGEMMCVALLAYALGGQRVPILAACLCFSVLGFLHAGKEGFRNAYWEEGSNFSNVRIGIIDGYSTWSRASWEQLSGEKENDVEKTSVMGRASIIQMIGLAVTSTPDYYPFLYGKSYFLIPQLLVPRVFWPGKPQGNRATMDLCIYYGIQTEEDTLTTGVSVGSIFEAWANFGWFGLVASSAFLGFLFGYPARISRDLTPMHVGWMLASLFLVFAVDQAHAVGEVLASLLTALIMAVPILHFISKPIVVKDKSTWGAKPSLKRALDKP